MVIHLQTLAIYQVSRIVVEESERKRSLFYRHGLINKEVEAMSKVTETVNRANRDVTKKK